MHKLNSSTSNYFSAVSGVTGVLPGVVTVPVFRMSPGVVMAPVFRMLPGVVTAPIFRMSPGVGHGLSL